ncbi:hypothetical protein COM32_13120 [Bacillus pseudomycoides]|uniref:hypothetical protein n=1 Tax=Bacillus pseudomycoides TaxID=64104 RepID=UPI000BF3225B|nr:hypothetical protein [Bacillus pseudomycoides]PGD26838.1 hypothetical protein COM32_13120 [Bacillus pseudomycoides]
MNDMDVIKSRLEGLETTIKQMYVDKMCMQGAINALGETVDVLKKYINDLEQKVRTNEAK